MMQPTKHQKSHGTTAIDRRTLPDNLTVSFVRKILCIFYGVLLIAALVFYGITLEKIMTIPYGPANSWFFQFFNVKTKDESSPGYEIFRDSPFLAFWFRMVGSIAGLFLIVVKGERVKNQAPLWKYLLISIFSSLASIMQYESLKYLAFTVQILAKCCKTLPVLCYGRCVKGKKYVLSDWFCCWLIIVGTILYMAGGPIDSIYSRSRSWVAGILLLVSFVILDGFVAFQQEKLYKNHEASKYNQMLWVNLTSCVLCFIFSLVTGRLPKAINFGCRYPVVWADMSFIGLTAVVGQWATHSMVFDFGASIFLAFLNVRMAISIVCSKLIFRHPTTTMQLVALAIVLFALLFRSVVSGTAWWSEETESGEHEPLVVDKTGEESTSRQTRADWVQQVIRPVKNVQRFTQQCAGCCLPISRV
mmetsp:Transcript_17003/g.36022  ORF Transcript_17003/g.36022 Transcript_17003/m.36022 type:complete len:417 (-) Transcript_17003:159-1409(-)